MLTPGEVIEIDKRRMFMDDTLWVRVTFIRYLDVGETHSTVQPWMKKCSLMLVEGEDGKQYVWSTHLRRYPLKETTGSVIDDRNPHDPVEFTESPEGERAKEKWAENYDALDGAPESDDDR